MFNEFLVQIKYIMSTFDLEKATAYINSVFDSSLIDSLSKFIEIPNLSKAFDPEFATNGLLEKAAAHIQSWVQQLSIKGLKTEIIKHPGYTPVLYTEVEGQTDATIMFYGHFDKQPHMEGWHAGKGAIKPVIENGKLYGRGGADDGYSTYCSMLAVKAVQLQGIPLPRIVMITEGDEESGGHIEYYLEALKEKIGNPQIIFCLDSGAFDYERMWLTNSLRGYIALLLKIRVLNEGVHSGQSSGIVPSCWKVANVLLNRLENKETGRIHQALYSSVPVDRYEESFKLAEIIGTKKFEEFQFVKGVQLTTNNALEGILNRAWRPQLTVTGITGMPSVANAGNVMNPTLQLRLSLRTPPTLDSTKQTAFLQKLLTENPPFNADITCEVMSAASGFNAPTYPAWLKNIIREAAVKAFGHEQACLGEGGSIPFMGQLAENWPQAHFVITGVLGPESNAHGPNEFLHIDYTKKVTHAMAVIVARTAEHHN